MRLHQLRSFVAVADELHFGRAGLRLGLSQPQVSRHIRDLEQTLGIALLARTPRRTELTSGGALLLADARDTLAAAERLRRRPRVVGRGGLGAVSVGFIWSTLWWCSPPASWARSWSWCCAPRMVTSAPARW
ncbi:MAG: LysR family transcriptional regulator [Solirubrobacteraceae bacterium]